MRRVLLAVLFVAGCSGDTDYNARFDELVPPGWTLDAATGSIESGCSEGPACGSIERRYFLNSDLASATRAMETFYPSVRCLAARQGNGVSVDCGDVRLAISVTAARSVTVVLTKT